MNNSKKKVCELTTLRIGFTTPGWPLKNFANGIVTYIQNVLPGVGASISPVILAGTLFGDEVKDRLIGLHHFNKSISLFQKLLLICCIRPNCRW